MSATKSKIKLKKLPSMNTVWHPESTLVFKSAKEKTIIGRLEDEEFISLDEDCVELCKQWKFKYDESLLNTEEPEEEEPEEEEGEEEEGEPEEDEGEDEPEEEEEGEEEEPNEEPEGEDEGEPEEETEPEPKKVSKKSTEKDDIDSAIEFVHTGLDTIASTVKTQKLEIVRLETELKEMTQKYTKMKAKFDGFKKMFSD